MRTSQTRLLGFAQLRLVFMRTSKRRCAPMGQPRSPSTSLRSSAGFGSPAALRSAECSCALRGLAILRLRSGLRLTFSVLVFLIEADYGAFTHSRNPVVFLRLNKILAKRIARPILRHQDPSHIAMALECDPEQIENLALHPISSAPNDLYGRDGRVIAGQFYLQHTTVAMLIREKMVDNFDVILVIHAGFVAKAVNRSLRIVTEETANIDDCSSINYGKPVKFTAGFENLFRESLLETFVYLERFHLRSERLGRFAAHGRATARS